MNFMPRAKAGAKIISHDFRGLSSDKLRARLAINMPPPAPAILSLLSFFTFLEVVVEFFGDETFAKNVFI